MRLPRRWDVFCAVVDNYGDIGVAWRLARQLAAEHGLDVRLYCDALAALARIAPTIDAGRDWQFAQGVQVRRWRSLSEAPLAHVDADAIIEMFGCGLPQPYLAAITQRLSPPVWINVEYLTAESWAETAHGLASRHPRLPLQRYFFFPGFTRSTGGLLRERELFARRDAFSTDRDARNALWRELGIAPPRPGTLVVSLFCYPNRALPALLDAWAGAGDPVLCAIPQGVADAQLEGWIGEAVPCAGRTLTRGRLTLAMVPFVAQDDYDRLLWACELNFVRGEDSFVRAQWAAHPLLWHIYPQAEDAHRVKLDAFLARYGADLQRDAAAAYGTFSRAWNDVTPMCAALWNDLARARPALAEHARAWAASLAQHEDFASSLVRFVANKVEY